MITPPMSKMTALYLDVFILSSPNLAADVQMGVICEALRENGLDDVMLLNADRSLDVILSWFSVCGMQAPASKLTE